MNISLTYLGILVALNTALWKFIHDSPAKIILFNMLVIILCVCINWCETQIRNSQSKILDFLIFTMTKNKRDYKIRSRIETYSINSKSAATFKSIADIEVTNNPTDFYYTDRFQWEQEEKFNIEVDLNNYRCSFEDDLNWTVINISPASFVAQKHLQKEIRYDITNLHITNLKKHSFFSYNPKDKIKVLRMVAHVDKSLNPNGHAKYVIQNNNGTEIYSGEIPYNPETESYEKTISYPRQTRKYIIQWDYTQ